MVIEPYHNGHTAHILSDTTLIATVEDGFTVLADCYYQGFDKLVLHEHHFTPAFFDLQNGMAGEILQKFSNYRMRLAIVGDFKAYTSSSITAFITESNRTKQINFVNSVEEALKVLSC
jgi:hypothetical protein